MLAIVALVSGATELGWLVMAGTAVAGAVVGALVGTVWAEESGGRGVPGAALGVLAAVLLVGLPAPVVAAVALTSAAAWTPWRRARRSGSSPWPRRPVTH